MASPSKRLDLIPPYLFAELARIRADAVAAGADVIDLGIGDPDIPTPAAIREALATAVENPETHRYDESPRGWPRFLDSAAAWYERSFGVAIDPSRELLELIGSKEGLAHLAWAYLDRGDVAIVPDPGYPVYKVNALMAGADVYETPLTETNAYLPRLADIPTEVARRAKLFYLCYPHNPTGAVATSEFYADAVRFCRDHDILLVNDMAYATVTFDGFVNPTVLQIPGAKDVALEFHSLSKMFNMTGWRIAFALGNPDAVATLARLKSNLDSKQFGAIAEAAAVALDGVSNADSFAEYARRRDVLCDGLTAAGWPMDKPKAGFFVWTRVPVAGMDSKTFCAELMRRAHVLAVPGIGYGAHGEGYVRMSLTVKGDAAGDRIAEAVRRISTCGILG
ncbi:MAG: aminotransferase class I/II-fold pyridoxal phosphate-dependent enzyme [Fimbriimonadaceae bacterium]|nr:aminotransferase class I/II-fold pyridoxal phosphate-dependent enzyme [Fimbriimonadaceae bacterium]